jgi:hypothetical protein
MAGQGQSRRFVHVVVSAIRDRLFPIFGPADRPGWLPSRARKGAHPAGRPGFQVVPAEDRPGATKRRWPTPEIPLGGIRHARLTRMLSVEEAGKLLGRLGDRRK